MKIFSEKITVRSTGRASFVDITSEAKDFVRKSGITNGVLFVFVPHTTCGVIVNENYDPTVQEDIQDALYKIAPRSSGYKHTEGNADAHIKTAIVGNSLSLPVEDSKINFGTWQGIFVTDFDGPRTRQVLFKILGE